jgi:asparagine synthase (glutamine-hydrolysing)
MPGLCGVASRQLPLEMATRHLAHMQELLRHRADQVVARPTLFAPSHGVPAGQAVGSLAAGAVWRTFEAGFAADLGPGLSLFVDGEAYGESAPLTATALAQLFAGLDPVRGDIGALVHLDGVYAAALADETRGILHLFTDPFGLRPLYIRETAGALWFSGELKGMLALGALEIDRHAASDFLRLGHFLGDATWFQGVRLMPPASHLRYDLATGRTVLTRYRNWPPDGRQAGEGGAATVLASGRTITTHAAAMALGPLLNEAVLRRTSPAPADAGRRGDERVGVLLSGGLDSRTLFAALPAAAEPVPALTFGRPACDDIQIALKVSALRPSQHTVIEITKENWFEGREAGVWLTDGQLSFTQMHGFESLPRLEESMAICLSGFLGDALLGGSYLDDVRWTLWEKYLHRGRRFILSALQHGGTRVRFRMPFLDLRLMDAVSVLPENLLRDSRVYRLALLMHWPDYFKSIPWQQTGLPLSLNPRRERIRVRVRRAMSRLMRLFTRKPRTNPGYADNAMWLRQEPGKSFIETILFGRSVAGDEGSASEGNAKVSDDTGEVGFGVLDMDSCRRTWQEHLAGRDHSEMLGRYLTVKIWLREVARRQRG